MGKERERSFHWDNVKFVLILLVVTGHFLGIYEGEFLTQKKLFYFINIFHMPAFIFVSGLFSKSAINGKKFRIDRVFFYALLYFLVKTMIFVISMFFDGNQNYELLNDQGVQWYMWAMVMFLCATRLFRRIRPGFLLGVAVLVAVFAGYDWTIGRSFSMGRFLQWYPFFLAGYYLDPEKVSEKLNRPWLRAVSAVFLLVLGYVCFFHLGRLSRMRPLLIGSYSYEKLPYPQFGGVCRLVYYVLAALACVAVFSLIPAGKTFFSEWGRHSLTIYFWHRPVLELAVKLGMRDILEKIWPDHWLWLYLACAILLTMVLLCPCFEKPIMWIKGQCAGQRMICEASGKEKENG